MSRRDFSDMEINNGPNKEFQIMIKLFTKPERRMDEYSENFNKETENTRNYQTEVTELKNTTTELITTLQGFKSKLGKA